MKRIQLWQMIGALALLLAGCNPAPAGQQTGSQTGATTQAEQPKAGGTLRVGIQNLDADLDPVQSRSGFTQHVWLTIMEKLVDLDPLANVVPQLATEWKVAPDGKEITLTMRDGVKFHDGTVFDANAAKFNLDRARDPKASRWSGLFSSITTVTATDAKTLKIVMSQPDVSVLTNLGHHGMFIVSPKAVTTGADGKVRFTPVGTGPFKVESYDADKVTAVKNAEYWDAKSIYLDKIVFSKITDATVRLAGLRSGDLDYIDAPAPQEIATIEQDRSLGFLKKPGVIGYIVRVLVNKPPFDNVSLRRAVGYAIDRDAVNKVATFGTGTAHQNFMYPAHWAFDKDFKGLPTDLEKAKEELRKGGQPNGFKFAITVTNREPELSMAQAVKAQLIKVGIDMEIFPEDSTKSFDSFRAGTYPSRLSGGSRGADPITDLDEWRGDSADNYFGYKNRRVDELMLAVRTNFDVKKRAEAMFELNKILFVDDPIGFMLGDAVDIKVWNAKLRGTQPAYSYPMRVAKLWWSETPKAGPVAN